MKKLIIKLLLVLLPVFIIIIVFELFARGIPTSYSIKYNYFNKKADKIEVLVVGSSHSNFGINPKYFGREAFNISNTSQGLYQDYKVLSKYLPKCKVVKMVIIPISYFSLQSELSFSPEAWRCAYYYFYLGVKADPSWSMFDSRNYSALFLWDGPRGVIKGIRNINEVNINEYGYQFPLKIKSSIDEIINDNTGRNRVNYNEKTMKDNLVGYNVLLLNRIAEELKERNIKIMFITPPVYKTYYSHISKERYNIMIKSVEDVVNKHSDKYYNYFYDDRFELNDFADNDHLNEEGAKKFSIILKNEVIEANLPTY